MARHGLDRFKQHAAVAEAVEPSSLLAEYRYAASTGTIDMRVLELLSARLCHELSGPIAAINNGVELLAEEVASLGSSPNPAFVHAMPSHCSARVRAAPAVGCNSTGLPTGSAPALQLRARRRTRSPPA